MSKVQQADLAELVRSHGKTIRQAGVSHVHFLDLAHGRREAGPQAIVKIATALGVEPPVVYAACQESVRRASAARARKAVRK